MTAFLIIIYVLVCLFLILVVLLQQGKGADLAGAFGGGGTQTSFGPRTSTNVMHRLTTWSFVAFVVLSLALAVLTGKERSSVMEGVTPPAAAAAASEDASPQVGPETPAEEAAVPAATESEVPAAEAGDTAPATSADEPANPPVETGSQN